MRVVVIGPNLPDQSKGSFHVHREGCAVTAKRQYRNHADDLAHPIEASTLLDVVTEVYPPGQFDYDPSDDEDAAPYVQDFYVFDCARSLRVTST